MAERRISIGDVLGVQLPTSVPRGHEQEGKRPVVVVALPAGVTRFPILVVVPLTTQSGWWATHNPQLYPGLPAGCGGLPRMSIALLDQIRGVDVRRLSGYIGSLTVGEYEPIRKGLANLLSF